MSKYFILQKYKELDLFWTVLEIFVMAFLLLVILTVRITPYFVTYFSYPTTKFVMSLGLLYFYYRVLIVFLPISPVLGPMLISIKRMVRLFCTICFYLQLQLHVPPCRINFNCSKEIYLYTFDSRILGSEKFTYLQIFDNVQKQLQSCLYY